MQVEVADKLEMAIRSAESPFLFSKRNGNNERRDTRMASCYLEAKVISRRAGQSVVAAAAYVNCSQILNDYNSVWQ